MTFLGLTIDWEGSLGSDHAMLHVEGNTRKPSPGDSQEPDAGFLIDLERGEEWTRVFRARSCTFAFTLPPTEAEIELEAAVFTADIHKTNKEIFRRRRPSHPKVLPWWNAACALVAQNLCNTQTTEMRGITQARLKSTVQAAKRKWADEYIEKSNLWDVVA